MRLDAHVRTDDPTTLALVELDDRGAAAYRFYTEGTASAGLTTEAALTALPRTRRTCTSARSAWCSSRWPTRSRRWWRSAPAARS